MHYRKFLSKQVDVNFERDVCRKSAARSRFRVFLFSRSSGCCSLPAHVGERSHGSATAHLSLGDDRAQSPPAAAGRSALSQLSAVAASCNRPSLYLSLSFLSLVHISSYIFQRWLLIRRNNNCASWLSKSRDRPGHRAVKIERIGRRVDRCRPSDRAIWSLCAATEYTYLGSADEGSRPSVIEQVTVSAI